MDYDERYDGEEMDEMDESFLEADYFGEDLSELELEEMTAEEIEAGKRYRGGRRPSRGRTRNRPSSVRRQMTRNKSRGRGRTRFRGKGKKVKITPKQDRERKKYDEHYNKVRRPKIPSSRKKRKRRRRRANENLEAIQSVMAEMGLYEIRPPDTDELYVPSGTNYSPSGGNGYWKRDPANKERRPTEKQDTSREPSDVGNSSRVVPKGQYVKASVIRVAYRFLMSSQ